MSQSKLHPEYLRQKALQDAYLARKNKKTDFYNGIYDRWENPVLTRESIPLSWRFDLDPETNPHFMERLGVNAVFNSGAIKLNGKYYLVARIEGNDRKSFFGVAESDSPVEGFHFWEKPILLPDTCPEETNVYDMRLTQHEDGWIYGVFCSESKDRTSSDLSAAVAAAGIVRTKDLQNWERLPNLKTLRSPQQRNVVLHPEFVDGQYAFYTRPMDDFIETGSGGGIGFGLCKDIEHPVIDEEKIISLNLTMMSVSCLVNLDWCLMGLDEFKPIALRNTAVKLLAAAAVFLFVRKPEDLWVYAFVWSLSTLLGCLSCMFSLRGKVTPVKVTWKEALKHLAPCALLSISVIAVSVYRQMDKVMIGALADMAQTGLYENAEKIILCLSGFISAIGTVMLPKVSRMTRMKQMDAVKRHIHRGFLQFRRFLEGHRPRKADEVPQFQVLLRNLPAAGKAVDDAAGQMLLVALHDVQHVLMRVPDVICHGQR